MYTETYLTKPNLLQKKIQNLHIRRRNSKLKLPRPSQLSKEQRKIIHSKTDGKCHFCSITLPLNKFQADHVICHVRGGRHAEENYLPACFTCNNCRRHFLPRELQIIVKLGVWAKTEIENKTLIGMEMAKKFTSKERSRMRRRSK